MAKMAKKSSGHSQKASALTFLPKRTDLSQGTGGRIVQEPAKPSKLDKTAIKIAVVKVSGA